MDEPSRQVSSRHKREKKKPRKEREIPFFFQTENSKLQAMKKSEHGKQCGEAINHGFFFDDDG